MTTFADKIKAEQRLCVANFVSDNYFPVLGDTITLTNTSIEGGDGRVWTVTDGVETTTESGVDAKVTIAGIVPCLQNLYIDNTVNADSYSKTIFPMADPVIVYGDIKVDKEIARVGDMVRIESEDLNTVPLAAVSYSFKVYDREGTVVETLTGKTNDIDVLPLGSYDIELTITTDGEEFVVRQDRLVTITPALPEVSASVITLIPVTPIYTIQEYEGGALLPGDAITIKLPDNPISTSEYRLRIKNLVGTAERPIIITIDQPSPLIWCYRSYTGLQLYNCQYVVLDGRGYHDLEYGLHFTRQLDQDDAQCGLSIGYLCSNIEVFGIESEASTFAGLMCKTDPDKNNPATWRGNYTFYDYWQHHCYFHDTNCEGNYIGYYSTGTITAVNAQNVTVNYRAHALEGCEIYRNKYYNIGWDGIQANNLTKKSLVCNNSLVNCAIYPEQDQATMMSLSLDGRVYANRCQNSGGLGIQFGTFEGIDIYNNHISGVASGCYSMMLMSSTNTPEQYGTDGINLTTLIRVYNNTCIASGALLSAQNVVQFHEVYVKNNLVDYSGTLLAGQWPETLVIWNANASNNFVIADDGTIYEVADLLNDDLQISPTSVLTTAGVLYEEETDIRGWASVDVTKKWVGAYSGYRRLSNAVLSLSTFSINNGAAKTQSRTVVLTYTSVGTAYEYMASEAADFGGASWIMISGAINFVLSDLDGTKKVYFKIRNSVGNSSLSLDDDIVLDRLNYIYVDLGWSSNVYQTSSLGQPPTAVPTWNNWTHDTTTVISAGTVLPALKYGDGTTSTIGLEVTNQISSCVINGPVVPTDGTVPIYPYTAYRDAWTAVYGSYGEITINGLAPNKTYTIKCYGARAYVTQRTIYTIQGVSIPLSGRLNYLYTADFVGLSPSAGGEIAVRFEGTSPNSETDGRLNVLEIIEQL